MTNQDAEYELNAQYDYIREAYAATALDPYHEAYSNYVFDAEDAGEEVLDFDDWKAREKARLRQAPAFTWTDADLADFPF